MADSYYEYYLAHHGILGQKWGVRRYQNEDGSLTAAGRSRYNTGEAKKSYKAAKKEYKEAAKEAHKSNWGTKKYRSMSSEEYTKAAMRNAQRLSDATDKLHEEKLTVELSKSKAGKKMSKKTKTALYQVAYDNAYNKMLSEKVDASFDKYHSSAKKEAERIMKQYSKKTVSEIIADIEKNNI